MYVVQENTYVVGTVIECLCTPDTSVPLYVRTSAIHSPVLQLLHMLICAQHQTNPPAQRVPSKTSPGIHVDAINSLSPRLSLHMHNIIHYIYEGPGML